VEKKLFGEGGYSFSSLTGEEKADLSQISKKGEPSLTKKGGEAKLGSNLTLVFGGEKQLQSWRRLLREKEGGGGKAEVLKISSLLSYCSRRRGRALSSRGNRDLGTTEQKREKEKAFWRPSHRKKERRY